MKMSVEWRDVVVCMVVQLEGKVVTAAWALDGSGLSRLSPLHITPSPVRHAR